MSDETEWKCRYGHDVEQPRGTIIMGISEYREDRERYEREIALLKAQLAAAPSPSPEEVPNGE